MQATARRFESGPLPRRCHRTPGAEILVGDTRQRPPVAFRRRRTTLTRYLSRSRTSTRLPTALPGAALVRMPWQESNLRNVPARPLGSSLRSSLYGSLDGRERTQSTNQDSDRIAARCLGHGSSGRRSPSTSNGGGRSTGEGAGNRDRRLIHAALHRGGTRPGMYRLARPTRGTTVIPRRFATRPMPILIRRVAVRRR
jgi:hypothetical protein